MQHEEKETKSEVPIHLMLLSIGIGKEGRFLEFNVLFYKEFHIKFLPK